MKKNKAPIYFYCIVLSILFSVNVMSQQLKESPVTTVQRIGDKLIRNTPFAYKLVLFPENNKFNYLKFIDFGRTFGKKVHDVGYAFTQMSFPRDTTIRVEIEHNDACKIWCNGTLVYEKLGQRDIKIVREERSL